MGVSLRHIIYLIYTLLFHPWGWAIRTRILFLFLFTGVLVKGQDYPATDFVAPLNIPLYLSGVFGECRSTHFHAGMDIKTNQIEGLPVFSIGDGYVSRIKVSAYGYGNALYVTHPNGYTSVYGHLQSFSKSVAAYIKQKQYEKESFEVDEYLPINFITFKKGEQIAKSGNSGGSGGPHLHFEIRDNSEKAINPQFLGIKIIDHLKPQISGIAILNMDNERFVSNPLVFNCVAKAAVFSPVKDTIRINSNAVSFAIETSDKMEGCLGKNGVYIIQLMIDGKPFFNYTMDKFGFDETRNVVGYVNQRLKETTNRIFQQCFVQPNQNFNCFKSNTNNGIYVFGDEGFHLVEIEVLDFQKNKSTLRFYVKKTRDIVTFKKQVVSNSKMLLPFQTSDITIGDLKLIIPRISLFDTSSVTYSKLTGNQYSPLIQIGRASDCFYTPIELGIKCLFMPNELESKALLTNKANGAFVTCGGRYENGYLFGKVKSLGSFIVNIDTTAPQLRAINIINNKVMTNESSIKFALTDNLSGVASYNAYLDGKWVLLEFDAKTALLKYTFDRPKELKSHDIVVSVCDERKNNKTYRWSFVY